MTSRAKRPHVLSVRLTDAEHMKLRARAREIGVSMSDVLRLGLAAAISDRRAAWGLRPPS